MRLQEEREEARTGRRHRHVGGREAGRGGRGAWKEEPSWGDLLPQPPKPPPVLKSEDGFARSRWRLFTRGEWRDR